MDKGCLYGQQYYEALGFGCETKERSDYKRILELLKIKSSDRVLEIGCGFGVLLKMIPSERKKGIETNGLAIRECRK